VGGRRNGGKGLLGEIDESATGKALGGETKEKKEKSFLGPLPGVKKAIKRVSPAYARKNSLSGFSH